MTFYKDNYYNPYAHSRRKSSSLLDKTFYLFMTTLRYRNVRRLFTLLTLTFLSYYFLFFRRSEEIIESSSDGDIQPTVLEQHQSDFLQQQRQTLPYILKRYFSQPNLLDWHDYIPHPTLQSSTARFFSGRDFIRSSKTNNNYGPLLDYTVCSVSKNPCVIHSSKETCLGDGFCGWCEVSRLCMDVWFAEGGDTINNGNITTMKTKRQCPAESFTKRDVSKYWARLQKGKLGRYLITRNNQLEFNDEPGHACRYIVPLAKHVTPPLRNEGMFYHFYHDFWRHLYQSTRMMVRRDEKRGRIGLNHRRIHYFVSRGMRTTFFEYFGFLTDSCYRFIEDLPEGVCIVDEDEQDMLGFGTIGSSGSYPPDPVAYIKDFLGVVTLENTMMTTLTIVARGNSRFILNMEELVAATTAIGIQSRIVYLEDLTIMEQVNLFSTTQILVAAHGSALANWVFLPTNAIVIELVPWGMTNQVDPFFNDPIRKSFNERGIRYLKYVTEQPTFHWHLLGGDIDLEERGKLLERAADVRKESSEFFTFWINQDMWVDDGKFRELLLSEIGDGVKGVRGRQWA